MSSHSKPIYGARRMRSPLQMKALARQHYPYFVPQAEALEELRRQVRAAVLRARRAQASEDRVVQAQADGGLVWLAGRLGLSLAGLGPEREDQWHELLRTAALPFDAATPLAQWYLGTHLDERLVAIWTLPERVLGVSLPVAGTAARTQAAAPTFQTRALPEALEAVEIHRWSRRWASASWRRRSG